MMSRKLCESSARYKPQGDDPNADSEYESDGGSVYAPDDRRSRYRLEWWDGSPTCFDCIFLTQDHRFVALFRIDEQSQVWFRVKLSKTTLSSQFNVVFNTTQSSILSQIKALLPQLVPWIRQTFPAGNALFPVGLLGEGTYATARLFSSTSQKTRVVLRPQENYPVSFEEMHRKARFFRQLYPHKTVSAFKINAGGQSAVPDFLQPNVHQEPVLEGEVYRLVLPELPGRAYYSFQFAAFDEKIRLFYAAIEALQHCHATTLVMIDLHADNIHYDPQTRQSYLLDGGHSVRIGERLPSSYDCYTVEEQVMKRTKYALVPPECFSVIPTGLAPTEQALYRTRADVSMDVYCLGQLMLTVFNTSLQDDTELEQLVHGCLNAEASLRPTLDSLRTQLSLWQRRKYPEYVNDLPVRKISVVTDAAVADERTSLIKSRAGDDTAISSTFCCYSRCSIS